LFYYFVPTFLNALRLLDGTGAVTTEPLNQVCAFDSVMQYYRTILSL
jgi:hypothetical protein